MIKLNLLQEVQKKQKMKEQLK